MDRAGEGRGDCPDRAATGSYQTRQQPEGPQTDSHSVHRHRRQMLPDQDQIHTAKELVDVGSVLADMQPMGDVGHGQA